LEYEIALDISQQRAIAGNPEFIMPVHIGLMEEGALKKFKGYGAQSGFNLQQYSDSITAKKTPEEIAKKKKK
jgi:hypothetical protein